MKEKRKRVVEVGMWNQEGELNDTERLERGLLTYEPRHPYESKSGRPPVKRDIVGAITASRGYISAASDLLGCSRVTIYRYLQKYPEAREALQDARERRHDHVESKLMNLIDAENVTAIIFYLKTQCKERGYVERVQQEVSGSDGGPITVTLTPIRADIAAQVDTDS